jgi:hypothetical protein
MVNEDPAPAGFFFGAIPRVWAHSAGFRPKIPIFIYTFVTHI